MFVGVVPVDGGVMCVMYKMKEMGMSLTIGRCLKHRVQLCSIPLVVMAMMMDVRIDVSMVNKVLWVGDVVVM